jgi:hypothetical protein
MFASNPKFNMFIRLAVQDESSDVSASDSDEDFS